MSANLPEPPAPTLRVRPEHGWVWAVLPAACRRVVVIGCADLARLLDGGTRDGARNADDVPAPDAVVLCCPTEPRSCELESHAATLAETGVLAVQLGGVPRRAPEGSRRLRRGLTCLGAMGAIVVTTRAASRVARRARAIGLQVSRIQTGERAARHRLRWTRGVPSTGTIIVARRTPQSSILEDATRRAAHAVGARPLRSAVRVLPTGALMRELRGPAGEMYLMRLGPATAGQLLQRATASVRAIAAAGPPPVVRDRLVLPLYEHACSYAYCTVEPLIDGHVPQYLTKALREQCIDFLVHLNAITTAPAKAPVENVDDDLRLLGEHVDAEGRQALERLAAYLLHLLAGVPRGWSHGDFWPRNLLVRRNRLVAVIDWDAAQPDAPLVLDVMHLLALSDLRLRRLSHGERCTEWLWPLTRAGGDDTIRRYAEAIGVRPDPRILEALGIVYWATRVARDLRTFGDRTQRPHWMATNLRRPLAALVSRGW